MKKLMIIGLLVLAGCTKKYDCIHTHVNGAYIEICSSNVRCLELKDETGTLKTCQYIPSEEKKAPNE